ncbi:MAG: alanine--tRNA ligase, partial [Anaerolineales bacterium]
WELLTDVWGLPSENMYVTVFEDELGEIPTDEEAVNNWKQQPGLNHEHILYFGRKDNFWEMAGTGPCGPNSEIHIDLGVKHGEVTYLENEQVDLDGPRFLELWNLVFIQYNRTSPTNLDQLPSTHVDTGLGFDRIVAVLQGQTSTYRTDLFWPTILKIQELAGQSDEERENHFTPYRVIADHARAATFLIADGVVPGNLGRNYVTRMVIRRASRFGTKIDLHEPFLAGVAQTVIDNYGEAYPELIENQDTILGNITREEERFQRTVESGIAQLENLLAKVEKSRKKELDGEKSFDLYATYGLPLEITRDVAQERGLGVDEAGFKNAMEAHRIASGGGRVMGLLGGEDAELFSGIFKELQDKKKLTGEGVAYDPYRNLEVQGEILSIVKDGELVKKVQPGDRVDVILPGTCFYIQAGGQVSDTGTIISRNGADWEIQVEVARQPAAGMIVHTGEVVKGKPKVGDIAVAQVDAQRRQDIMRNHTATHLMHAELRSVLGDHARQAGSLVAPDRLRFDLTHPDAITPEQLSEIEARVNNHILKNYPLKIEFKTIEEAKDEGAVALFGEKYTEQVRTIQIGDDHPFSYELCGGTHVQSTGEIGSFIIISEGSAAAGVRRIEAITGRAAYEMIQKRIKDIQQISDILNVSPDHVIGQTQSLLDELSDVHKEVNKQRRTIAFDSFEKQLKEIPEINGIKVLSITLPSVDQETLRQMADRFRQKYKTGVAVLASVPEGKPVIIAAVTDELVKRGWHAGNLVKVIAKPVGGSGGGKPTLAQAGGKDTKKLPEAMKMVQSWVEEQLSTKK